MSEKPISPLRQRLLEDMTVRNFVEKTKNDYVRHVKSLAAFLGRSPDTATPEALRRFQLDQTRTGVRPPTVNGTVAALRFFFTVTLDRPEMARHLTFVHEPRRVPIVMSPEEVARFLESAPGPKWKAALSAAYGAGLRVSEVVALKVSDIDSQRMLLRIEQGKGRKDRHAMLSPQLLELLRDWYRIARPPMWLFPGQNPVNHITARQFSRVVYDTAAAAEIKKRVSPHTLRHSFATHGDIAYQNKQAIYDLLCKVAAETMLTIAADPKHLGARIAITSVLHTWGSAMTHHPHVHMIVPGGGIALDGSRWVACKPNFFLPVLVLSRLFRRLMLEKLAAAHKVGKLTFFGEHAHLADKKAFAAFLAPLKRTRWFVYAKRPFAGPEAVSPTWPATPTASPSPTAV